MGILIFKAPCPVCKKTVFHAKPRDGRVEFFEVVETKMLAIVGTPEIEGKKRFVLGPCQKEEPVSYWAHVKHGCLPSGIQAGQMGAFTGSSVSNAGQVFPVGPGLVEAQPGSAPPAYVPVPAPAPMDPLKVERQEEI